MAMTSNRFLATAAASAFAIALTITTASAHDNVVVHRRLGEESVRVANNPFYTGYSAEVREGSYGEDVPATRSLGHFYNPETDSAPWFALGSGPAWENSQEQYDAAVDQYLANNLVGEDAAYYRMGRALHFIQDMTSVAHVHDDQHGTDPEDFEDWGPAHVNDFDYTLLTPIFAANPTAAGYVKEISRVVYDRTIYQAVLDAYDGCPSQCQPNSLLRTMFPSLHYEDGGFFDGDTWVIDRIGPYDTFGGLSDGWWLVDEHLIEDNGGRGGSSRKRGGGYVENTGGDGGEPVPVVFGGQPNTNNETMLRLYGRNFYPLAIQYGAGLLSIFANEVGPDPTATATRTHTPTIAVPTDTPTITPTPGNTDTPTSTATPTGPTRTPTETPTPAPLCGAAPRSDCRTPAISGKSLLILRENGSDDTLIWKWLKGYTADGGFGSPAHGSTEYALCIYDETAETPALVSTANIPARGMCSGRECWSERNTGFLYRDPELTPNGIFKMTLREGFPDKARIIVKGKGALLPMPSLPRAQDREIIVQLANSDGNCWSSTFSAPALRNDSTQFRDLGR